MIETQSQITVRERFALLSLYFNSFTLSPGSTTSPTCNEEDSIDHLLTECSELERTRIWELCQKLWYKKAPLCPWPGKHTGLLLGAPLADFRNDQGVRLPGLSRLYRIVMTESAHLIWRLRCERRIDRVEKEPPTHPISEIDRRWTAAINSRLALDCEMTRAKYGHGTLAIDVVQNTWRGLLRDEQNLPPRWANTGFLVGMGPLD